MNEVRPPTPVRFMICGMPRSGTTLLAELLSQRRGVGVSPESHALPIAKRLGVGDSPSAEARRVLLEAMIADTRCTLDHTVLTHAIEDIPDSPPRLVDFMFWLIARDPSVAGAKAVGEKTPRHVEHLDAILESTSDVRVIGLVRDPRDVARSLDKVAWSQSGPARIGLRWSHDTAALVDAERRNSERVRLVRYEDVVSHPDASVEDLVGWLLPDTPTNTLRPEMEPQAEQTYDPVREPWKARAAEPVDPSAAERWRQQPAWRDDLVAHAADPALLRRFGYIEPQLSAAHGVVLRATVGLVRRVQTFRAKRRSARPTKAAQ